MKKVLSTKKRFFIIIPILMIIFVLLFSFIISYYTSIQKYAHLNADGYSITDTFDVEEFKEFLAEDNLYKIKKLYSHFNQVWKDRYYVMTDQPVAIDKAYSEQFAYGYGTVDSDKLNKDYVNCCQMNDAAIKGSPMELESGRWFNDLEYSVNDTIPVIVGSHYQEHLKIGDKISIRYLYKDFDCNVIGVLKEGSRTAKNEYSMLDDYLIIAMSSSLSPCWTMGKMTRRSSRFPLMIPIIIVITISRSFRLIWSMRWGISLRSTNNWKIRLRL